jgi:hypothetical protein
MLAFSSASAQVLVGFGRAANFFDERTGLDDLRGYMINFTYHTELNDDRWRLNAGANMAFLEQLLRTREQVTVTEQMGTSIDLSIHLGRTIINKENFALVPYAGLFGARRVQLTGSRNTLDAVYIDVTGGIAVGFYFEAKFLERYMLRFAPLNLQYSTRGLQQRYINLSVAIPISSKAKDSSE